MAVRDRYHMFDAGFESPISKFITGFQSPISNSECRFLFQIGTKLINFVLKHINYQINWQAEQKSLCFNDKTGY